ncbi:D-alanyl-D-alanine endopeptidase [Alcanivorax sp. 1008]|uniref:D-alanyl-D-alanine endopeptidase n=1 Tax=Alcanivorax sp. 1008 TaxID=2816853 RepID=UPI001D3E530A|nr:D-alanyl-D-alanine endopeptidase [Alcanivorax sp. 1008]MCC1495438.1 D-alanyl-D-alanine endopeptidase [Alcanivorax sp. 1008]
MNIRRLAPWLAAVLLCASGHSLGQTGDVQLASVHAAVARLADGELQVAKHADRQVPIASITKLMTAMVVLDAQQDLNEWLTVQPRQQQLGKTAWTRMRNASQAKRRDLLHIALMSSENIACDVLARHFPGGLPAFVKAMNSKATELGMRDTVFFDPAGLSPSNVSTAADLVKMVRAAYQYDLIRDVTTSTYHQVTFRKPRYSLQYGNTNPLVRSSRWDVALSKTGYLSEAGRCLVMVSKINGEQTVLVLLDSLGTRTPVGDAGRLRRWLESGDPGSVAVAARNYERERSAAYRADAVSHNVTR